MSAIFLRYLTAISILASLCLISMSGIQEIHSMRKASDGYNSPVSTEDLQFSVVVDPREESSHISYFKISLPDEYPGTLFISNHEDLKALLIHESDSPNYADTITLMPKVATDMKYRLFHFNRALEPGVWHLEIPDGYFEVHPEFITVDEIPAHPDSLETLSVAGAWRSEGEEWTHPGLFTIQDDDGIDGAIPSSLPSDYMRTGYFSLLYPMLESLGLRGALSMEGRRMGFTHWAAPYLNENGQIARRLQDEKDWEIMSHSMQCLGETLNNWRVDSLDTPLADKILAEAINKGEHPATVTVYDAMNRKQYRPNDDNTSWIESTKHHIKPYIGDYATKRPIRYNPDFDVDYHWGEWFRLAKKHGIKGRCYVTHNTTTSHSICPEISKICPNGFADTGKVLYNVPPLMSTATRLVLEGQVLPGYKGEKDTDNKWNKRHYDLIKNQIDRAHKDGGWIVFGIHAYRLCWKNSLPGALISEGGDYPDEWVAPLDGIDPLSDPLTPPERLGIKNWSEWYPCPGTRLHMIWDLLKYARDLGMINVTSAEGFEIIGNRTAAGYYNNGLELGEDVTPLADTHKYYPHYVVGANGARSYYKPLITKAKAYKFTVTDSGEMSGVTVSGLLTAYTPAGVRRQVGEISELPAGIWIVNGRKILVR